MSGLFDVLGDPTRRSLVEMLSMEGPRSAGDLAGELPISRQAVVKQLGVLEDAGVVDRRRVGRRVEYRLVPDALDEIERWTVRVRGAWADRLERLRDRTG